MSSGGGDAPPSVPLNGGEFLLQLLRKPPNSDPPAPSPPLHSHAFTLDPAVAAVGSTIPTYPVPQPPFRSNGLDFSYRAWSNNQPPFAPHNFFPHNPNSNPLLNPDVSSPPQRFNQVSNQYGEHLNRLSVGDDVRKLQSIVDYAKPCPAYPPEKNIIFGTVNCDIMRRGSVLEGNTLHDSLGQRSKLGNSHMNQGLGIDKGSSDFLGNLAEISGNTRGNYSAWRGLEQERRSDRISEPVHPPGFSSEINNLGKQEYGNKRAFNHNLVNSKGSFGKNNVSSNQFDYPGLPAVSSLHSVLVSDIEKSMRELLVKDVDNGDESGSSGMDKMSRDQRQGESDEEGQLAISLGLGEEFDEKSEKKSHIRDKDYRSDKRGQWIMGQRMRNLKRQMACRSDIRRLDMPFLAVHDSLIPADEEKVKQQQLLSALEKLVNKEWPDARLYLYGSCANSFSFSKSDLDICLAMEDENIDKCEILLKLADILQSNNFRNVQALTRARVPIVKLMDPDTGISCDICVNNVLAVVNTKLLQDYAQIDVRLRQLAFIVKYWAKSRGVNETYQGTLSSYAYVLMCIHFLQQRRPAILPCLQGMHASYSATVDNVECAYFDEVDKLSNFGSRNGESIGRLVWAFFFYWAYCHDYTSDVISIRTGSTLSKRAKDWTRRVGNDRHLICIEDPFEVSHDLGRVVDKYSIRVLREEFERAAHIMQYDPNPCVTLFEPYVPI